MKDVLEEFACVVADTPSDIMSGGGVDLWVTKQQFEVLLEMCFRSHKCAMIIYDFRTIEDEK
jgi:hypothetical protein